MDVSESELTNVTNSTLTNILLLGIITVTSANKINVEEETIWLNQTWIICFLVAVVSVGILGNFLIMYVINSEKGLHRAPYYYLLCISVMDMFKSIFCLPFVIEVVLHNFQWGYKNETCIALAFETSFYTISTAVALVAIAVDRYLSFSATKMYNKCLKVYWNRIVIAVGCGVSFCISFPPVFERGTYKFVPLEMQCTLYHLPYRENKTFGYTVTFVCMLLLTMFLYCRLFHFMRSHRRMAPLTLEPARSRDWTFFGPGTNGQLLANHMNGFLTGAANPIVTNNHFMLQQVQRRTRDRLGKNNHETRLFFTISVFFIVLWIPYLFQTFTKVFDSELVLPGTFITLSALLSYAHVAVSPLIGLCLGSPIRSAIAAKCQEVLKRKTYHGVATSETNVF